MYMPTYFGLRLDYMLFYQVRKTVFYALKYEQDISMRKTAKRYIVMLEPFPSCFI